MTQHLPSLPELIHRERAQRRARHIRQLGQSLQQRRDAGDREGAALAAAWLAELRGAA